MLCFIGMEQKVGEVWVSDGGYGPGTSLTDWTGAGKHFRSLASASMQRVSISGPLETYCAPER
jgi:hypothetical protein